MTLKVNNLIGFGSGGRRLERVEFLDVVSPGSLASGTQLVGFDFANSIENANRRIFMFSAQERNGTAGIGPSSIRFHNGSTYIDAVMHVTQGAVSEDRIHIVIASAIVPTNDYDEVEFVTGNGSGGGFQMGIVAANFLSNSTPSDSAHDVTMADRTGSLLTLDIPANALVLGMAATTGPSAVSWDKGTEVLDSPIAGIGLSIIADGYVAEELGAVYTATRSGSAEICTAMLAWT